jgi:hypothetical protein
MRTDQAWVLKGLAPLQALVVMVRVHASPALCLCITTCIRTWRWIGSTPTGTWTRHNALWKSSRARACLECLCGDWWLYEVKVIARGTSIVM